MDKTVTMMRRGCRFFWRIFGGYLNAYNEREGAENDGKIFSSKYCHVFKF